MCHNREINSIEGGWAPGLFLTEPLTLTTLLSSEYRGAPHGWGSHSSVIIERKLLQPRVTKATGPISKQLPQRTNFAFPKPLIQSHTQKGWQATINCTLREETLPACRGGSDFTGLPNGYKDKSKHYNFLFCLWPRGSGAIYIVCKQ